MTTTTKTTTTMTAPPPPKLPASRFAHKGAARRGITAIGALLLLLNVICSSSITAVTGDANAPNASRGSTPTDFLNDLLDEHRYDSRLRPNFNGDPTNITINFFCGFIRLNQRIVHG